MDLLRDLLALIEALDGYTPADLLTPRTRLARSLGLSRELRPAE